MDNVWFRWTQASFSMGMPGACARLSCESCACARPPARCFELLLFLLMHQISLAISHDLGVAKTSSGDTQMLFTCQAVTFSTLITVPAFPDATLNKLMPAMAAAAGVTSMFAVIATRPPCQYASKKVLST